MLKDRPPNPKPEPLGVAVFPLLGACMSQRSGRSGGEPVEGGKVLRSSPLFLAQGGLRLVVALQGAPASAEPQLPTANSPVCLEKAPVVGPCRNDLGLLHNLLFLPWEKDLLLGESFRLYDFVFLIKKHIL